MVRNSDKAMALTSHTSAKLHQCPVLQGLRRHLQVNEVPLFRHLAALAKK